MRQFFRIILLALVLVMVFLASAMTAMRVAIHGREVAIPKLVGMTPADAERASGANGLPLDIENRFYSADVPEGRILSQVPAPGEKVRRGWKVRAALSLGPQRVSIPNVIGQSDRAAEINLTRRGLQMGNVATVSLPGIPGGQIVAQSPMPEAEGVASPKVNLLVTEQTEDKPQYFVMPDFTGRRFGEATSAMAIAGFRVGAVKVTASGSDGALAANGAAKNNGRLKPIATDVVASQSPAPGQKVGAGAAINFEVTR